MLRSLENEFGIPLTDLTPTRSFTPEIKFNMCDVLDNTIVEGTMPISYLRLLSDLIKLIIDDNEDLLKIITRSINGFISKKGIL
jgi:hypothetical protein